MQEFDKGNSWGNMGLGLAGLNTKGLRAGETFVMAKNSLALGGAVSPGSRPQVPEHQEYRK